MIDGSMVSTIGDIVLSDEFALLPYTSVLADVAKALSPVKNSAALIRGPKGAGIAGIVKVQTLLEHLASEGDPLTVRASSIMLTDLFRVRVDIPISKAVREITERKPDAVLVLDKENTFVGYLSAEDFRSLKQRIVGDSVEEKQPETIGEAVELRDEFRMVSVTERLDKVSLLLRRPSVQFVLAQDSKKGVQGILSVQQLLSIFSQKKNPNRETVKKHMRTNLLRLREDTPIQLAIETIQNRHPDGVLVLGMDDTFRGLLSPDDYRTLKGVLPKEIEHDGTFNTLLPYLKNSMSLKDSSTVVWSHNGSELIVKCGEMELDIIESELCLSIPVYCDQTDEQTVTIRFSIGAKLTRTSLVNRSLECHEIIENQWGLILIESIWEHVLTWIDSSVTKEIHEPLFSINSQGLLITGKNSNLQSNQEVKING
tara:strand:+ start:323 stop:1603 length:1281 start_codon:yes stop_codon:yes gene_type:complete